MKKDGYATFEHWLASAEGLRFAHPDEAIVTLYRRFQSLKRVAKALGVSYMAIRCHLIRLGEPIRGRGGANNGQPRYAAYQGETRSIRDWADQVGISYKVLYNRLFTHGWPIERALSQPVQLRPRKDKYMQVTEITVSAGRTFNHPYESYSNLRPYVQLKAAVEPGEDVTRAVKDLQNQAEKLVEDHKQNMLTSLERLEELNTYQGEVIRLKNTIEQARARLTQLDEQYELPLPSEREAPDADYCEFCDESPCICGRLEEYRAAKAAMARKEPEDPIM